MIQHQFNHWGSGYWRQSWHLLHQFWCRKHIARQFHNYFAIWILNRPCAFILSINTQCTDSGQQINIGHRFCSISLSIRNLNLFKMPSSSNSFVFPYAKYFNDSRSSNERSFPLSWFEIGEKHRWIFIKFTIYEIQFYLEEFSLIRIEQRKCEKNIGRKR